MNVSVIIRCRNEYPQILQTLNHFHNELEFARLDPWEIVVVENAGEDSTLEVLADKYRRFTRAGLLKLVRYSEKPSTWCAINAGINESSGDVVVIADAHISFTYGTVRRLVEFAGTQGGIWHAPLQKWGDPDRVRTWGHDLKLVERFWGDPCGVRPAATIDRESWPIPAAGACLMAVQRAEIEKYGAYHPAFRAYGGGEPYLALKWWLLGSRVSITAEGLCRHAFGLSVRMEEAGKKRRFRKSPAMTAGGDLRSEVAKGEKYLAYDAGYSVPNRDFHFNFLLAAYVIGGDRWLDLLAGRVEEKLGKNAGSLREEARQAGESERREIEKRQAVTLEDLLADPPWVLCERHPMVLPPWMEKCG